MQLLYEHLTVLIIEIKLSDLTSLVVNNCFNINSSKIRQWLVLGVNFLITYI